LKDKELKSRMDGMFAARHRRYFSVTFTGSYHFETYWWTVSSL